MKTKRLNWVLISLSILTFFSCSTIRTTVSTKSISTNNQTLIQAPLVAELNVESMKKVEAEKNLTRKERKIYKDEEIEKIVITQALEANDADVMIEPRFTEKHNRRGRLLSMSVTGYAAQYDNFRTYEAKDSILLDAIYGRERSIARVYDGFSTPSVGGGGLFGKNPLGLNRPKTKKNKLDHNSGMILSGGLGLTTEDWISFDISAGYQFGTAISTGIYAYIPTDSYPRNFSAGVFLQYTILKTRLSPFIRGQLGFNSVSIDSDAHLEARKIDYRVEGGVQYRFNERNSLALGVGVQQVYDYHYHYDYYSSRGEFALSLRYTHKF